MRHFLVITLLSVFAISAFSQEYANPEPKKLDSIKNEWWYPILQKHGLELKNYYAYHSTYIIGI